MLEVSGAELLAVDDAVDDAEDDVFGPLLVGAELAGGTGCCCAGGAAGAGAGARTIVGRPAAEASVASARGPAAVAGHDPEAEHEQGGDAGHARGGERPGRGPAGGDRAGGTAPARDAVAAAPPARA